MKKSGKKIREILPLLVISLVWFGIGWMARDFAQDKDIRLVEQVRQSLLQSYPMPMPTSRELSYAAIRGMLLGIDDRHAALLEPEVSQRFEADFEGSAGVIGIIAEASQGEIVISYVFPGEPAEQAGLRPGDVILSVDGVPFDRFTTEIEASLLIRGPVDTPARFVVRRRDQVLEFNPLRKPRVVATGELLEGDIAYLAHNRFTDQSPGQVRQALQELLAQDPKGLIWDLRGNGGGSMEATQEILSFFIQDGLLFKAELKDGQVKEFPALKDSALATDLPLVVLIGPGTYSSAETSAAAILEHSRGTLVGETTYGKGTIQNTVPLLDGSRLQFTLAKWLSPSGEWFEARGVPPQVTVADDPDTPQDEVLQRAIDILKP